MGMFNSIYADLLCPDKNKISKDTEIQIKWQKYEAWVLAVYHLGDKLEDIEDEYNNNWIRINYICNVCSKHTIEARRNKGTISRWKNCSIAIANLNKSRNGSTYIKTEDQKWHFVFIKIDKGQIAKILTEKEFAKQAVFTFITDY